MIPLRTLLRGQRGSALLISLVMIVVITILGLALFELGQIEGQQSGASLGDARAFELAQAGTERAIRELRNGILADAYGSESWVDGANRPTCTPACETAVYHPMNLANNTLPAAGANPLTGRDPGGTFTVELKQVSVAEANNPISQGAGYTYPYGQTCIPSTPLNGNACANLMFVRSTGTVAGPPGYTAVRTVQALVKAYSTSYFAGGLTAQKATGGCVDPAIDGRVLIAGSIHVLGCSDISPAFRMSGGGAMGMRNSWSDLWPDTDLDGLRTLARLSPRPAICPTGANCTGGANLVESLGAELKVYGNISNTMVTLNGGTNLGINTIQTAAPYGDATINPPNFTGGTRYGKGFIDGVYVSNGCPMPCTSSAFSLGGGSTIYVDTNNYTKPYPYRPPKLPLRRQIDNSNFVIYPTAADGTVINGTTYLQWWSDFFATMTNAGLNPLLVGAPLTQPASATLTDARLNAQTSNGGYCGASYAGKAFGATFVAGLWAATADDATGRFGFCHTFKWVNKAGAVTVGEICWRRRDVGLVSNDVSNLPPNYATRPTLEFGIPSCSAPNDPSNPLLIHHNNTWTLAFTSPQTDYQYRGAAIIFTNTGVINVENTLQTVCDGVNTPRCDDDLTTFAQKGYNHSQRFPEGNLLILINRQLVNVNIANATSANPVNRFMGYVYSEGAIQTQFLSNLVGSLRAQQFCFNNSSSTNGCSVVASLGGNPRFYQVSFQDLRKIPAESPASSGESGERWLVDIVPRFWIECRRGPGDGLPLTPTGTCQYQ